MLHLPCCCTKCCPWQHLAPASTAHRLLPCCPWQHFRAVSTAHRLLPCCPWQHFRAASTAHRLLPCCPWQHFRAASTAHRLLPCCPWQHLAQSSTHRLAPALSHRLHFRARGTQGTKPTQEFIDSSTRRLWSQNGAPMRRFAVIDSPRPV